MLKKSLALFLILLMTMTLAPGSLATSDNFNETGLPIVNEKITLNVAVGRHAADASDNYDEKHFAILAEEETNIHINWIEVLDVNRVEQVAVMLAGNMPDVIIGLLDDAMIVQNPDLFVPLNDVMETYTPNVYSFYEAEIDDWRSFLTYPDGNIYGLMGGYANSYTNLTDGAQFINMEWLERVGKEVPTTMDEFRDVLRAFRDQDANGNGDPNDEIPLDFCQALYSASITNYAWSWGLPFTSSYGGNRERRLDVDDSGNVIGTVNTQAYREFLEYFHEMGKEGLINLEGFSQTHEQFNSNLDSMRVGTFFAWAPYSHIKGTENQLQYDSIPPMLVEDYTPRVGMNSRNTARRNNFVINKNSAHVLEALRWWDYLSQSQDFAMFVNRGEDGLIYRKADDGLYYSTIASQEDLEKYGYEKYASQVGTSSFNASLGTVNNHPLVKNAVLADYINEPTTSSAIRVIGQMKTEPYWVPWSWPQAIITAEANEELQFATQGLFDYIESYMATAILEGVTDESWDAYLAQLESYGYSTYLAWYQRYFDGTL